MLETPSAQQLLAALKAARNDLEPPALTLQPLIGEALALLRATSGCRLARMSGSGATVFGLYDDCTAAAEAGKQVPARAAGLVGEGDEPSVVSLARLSFSRHHLPDLIRVTGAGDLNPKSASLHRIGMAGPSPAIPSGVVRGREAAYHAGMMAPLKRSSRNFATSGDW